MNNGDIQDRRRDRDLIMAEYLGFVRCSKSAPLMTFPAVAKD